MSVPDEMVDGHGRVKSPWGGLLGALSALGDQELAVRAALLDQAVQEEGAAVQLPESGGPAWGCDPVPLLISAPEFDRLERGLVQRARLLEAVLADLYGPQSLLADGHLPPALVFANPAFLRPGRPRVPDAGPFLHAYAADLIRTADGVWRVVADRTSGAPGAGYAREARNLMARVLPELFRAAPVHGLRPFFEAWAAALPRLARPGPDGAPAAAAVLTPGAASPHWFEHMVLSRELSLPLVEGRDLTVREGGVWLKTLRGLRPVGVLLRKQDGRMMDPLELEPGSTLGVPGLLAAVRQGWVRVLNDPGAGAVEAPAFAAFLPALSRRLLGEGLDLPTLPTMWLGDEAARLRVCQNPARWRLRPAMDGTAEPIEMNRLDNAQRGAMVDRMQARSWDWVATAGFEPSVAPVRATRGLDAAPVVLRLFLMHDGLGWRAMEGGLAWSPRPADPLGGGLVQGARFKDVWVVGDPERPLRPAPPPGQPRLPVRRTTGDLPSRVADDFFWFGRYVERLEGGARLGQAMLIRLTRGAPLPRDLVETQVLMRALTEAGLVHTGALPAEALADALQDGELTEVLHRLAGLADGLRDRLTAEMHAAVTQALRAATAGSAGVAAGARLGGLAQAMAGLLRLSTLVAGLAAENMVRGGGWLFLELGRRVERASASALHLACILDQPAARTVAGLHLALELCDSAITYRHRYGSAVQPGPALDLLLADPGNPRALAFQFVRAAAALEEVGDQASGLGALAKGLADQAEALAAGVMRADDPEEATAALPTPLRVLAGEAGMLSVHVTRQCFTLLATPRPLDWVSDRVVPMLRGAA